MRPPARCSPICPRRATGSWWPRAVAAAAATRFFASSTRQAPRHSQPGDPGGAVTLSLSLKLVADIGLVGLPNAGKSTFIRAVSRSQAKVGAYPFTTLVPNLGVARLGDREYVVADIPGLVAGAHEGHGLGDRFLKHLERTRALVHLLSLSPDAADPLEAYDTVQTELAAHSAELASRPQVVVLNKIDLLEDAYEVELWRDAFAARGVEVMAASGLAGDGVTEVLRRVVAHLQGPPGAAETASEPWSPV
jgi:GTP-binding protein